MPRNLSSSRTETTWEERRGKHLREVSIAHPTSWIGLIAAQGLQSTCPVPSAISNPSVYSVTKTTHTNGLNAAVRLLSSQPGAQNINSAQNDAEYACLPKEPLTVSSLCSPSRQAALTETTIVSAAIARKTTIIDEWKSTFTTHSPSQMLK